MKNWTGTTIQQQALTVGCRYCLALVGEVCMDKAHSKPLEAFPAHEVRIRDARKGSDEIND